jgi:hypothetical protein
MYDIGRLLNVKASGCQTLRIAGTARITVTSSRGFERLMIGIANGVPDAN